MLSACGDGEIRSQDVAEPLHGEVVAQEGRVANPPGQPSFPAAGDVNMAQQQLPAGAVSQAGNPAWSVPQHWQEGPASSVRRGSFIVQGQDGGSADVSVTAFPGDVGGMVQNVNRWRQQLGLLPATPQDIEGSVRPFRADGQEGYTVQIVGSTQQTVAVALPHRGTTWFFKMTGPTALVEQEQAAFLAFAQSVDFPDGE